MRSFWNGSIGFGLVNIPIRLYRAVNDRPMKSHYLHKKDLSPVRFARICKEENVEIPFDEIVRGYETESGELVPLSEDEVKKASGGKSDLIEILHFVEDDEIDLLYAETPYYLEPEKRARKSYALLREALERSGKAAIARYTLRTRPSLGVIKPKGDVLFLAQLRYPEEVRDAGELDMPAKGDVAKKELDMALTLVDQLTQKFNPDEYEDTFTTSLQAMISKKQKGQRLPKKTKRGEGAEVLDLMAALRESLKQTPAEAPAKKKRERKARPERAAQVFPLKRKRA